MGHPYIWLETSIRNHFVLRMLKISNVALIFFVKKAFVVLLEVNNRIILVWLGHFHFLAQVIFIYWVRLSSFSG